MGIVGAHRVMDIYLVRTYLKAANGVVSVSIVTASDYVVKIRPKRTTDTLKPIVLAVSG